MNQKKSDGASSWQDALRGLLPDGYEPQPEEPAAVAEPPKPKLSVTLDRKRAGKTATIVAGFDAADPRCDELAAQLRRALATGGSARGGEILVQGDRRRQVAEFLRKQGYKVQC